MQAYELVKWCNITKSKSYRGEKAYLSPCFCFGLSANYVFHPGIDSVQEAETVSDVDGTAGLHYNNVNLLNQIICMGMKENGWTSTIADVILVC